MTSGAIVVCTWGGQLGDVEETLTLARKLRDPWNAALHWLLLGAPPEQAVAVAARYDVAQIDHTADSVVNTFRPDVYVEALAQYCAQHSPRAVLFTQTHESRLAAARLAGRLSCAVALNAMDLEPGADGRLLVTASAYGGDTRAVYELTGTPAIVAIAANAVAAAPLDQPSAKPSVREIHAHLSGVVERIRVVAPAQGQSGPRLEDAQVIVAGGRGLGAPENFRLVQDLAEALGGMAAASRPIVDDGWIDSSRQVGLTGKITRPALYIAAGISGASQHMVGCAAAKTIVAINRDPEAAVFRYARYGIVGDCLEVLPELIRAAKARRAASA
jgi:electron transfer flavoprotein alpha subunit